MTENARPRLAPQPAISREPAISRISAPSPRRIRKTSGRFRVSRSTLAFAVALAIFASVPASGYSPSDPIVQEMVRRGIDYLESLEAEEANRGSYSEPGSAMLIAYAHYKIEADPENPIVRRGVEHAKDYLRKLDERPVPTGETKAIYEISVAALLLAQIDPVAFKPQLQQAQRLLYAEQFSNGGWGYKGERNGDTSQTQYALLALWTLDHVGVSLDYARVKRAAEWLLRVQDVSGGWPYHGVDPGPGAPLTRQTKVSMSMALAGGSSLLIAGDALRAWGNTKGQNGNNIEGLPKALMVYREETERQRPRMSKEPILRSIALCEQYRQRRPYKRSGGLDWYYYQLYTLERYESFIEIVTGKADNSPAWYNQVVEELRLDQDPKTGGWGILHRAHTHGAVSTAFAVLFLIRSTQKSIDTIGRGTLAGGRELPGDTTEIRVEGTQIKGRPAAEAVTDLLDILDEDGGDRLAGQSLPEDLKLASDPAERKAQLDRLERLVRGSQSWQARRVAARVLGSSDEPRVVPALIYALSDPDTVVRKYARDGLRFISRKFDGFDMPDEPTSDEVREAQAAWRAWYRTIDPTHVFVEFDL